MSMPAHRHPHDLDEPEDHDLGLAHDLAVMADRARERRRAMGYLLGATLLPVFASCGGGSSETETSDTSTSTSTGTGTGTGTSTGTGSGTTTTTSSGSVGSCSVINEETQGPYPADGSNTAPGLTSNVLALSGVVRSDITSSFGSASGTAGGVPLTLELHLVNAGASCADLSGRAIYVWHCDREGRYSLYSSGVTNQNYLRGVQVTDSSGKVTFETIFPGCYSGRMPHIHFEVYRSETTATSWTNKLKTSQIAFPRETCQTIYSTASGYSASVTNLASITFATDNVFSDGYAQQLATLSGSVSDGYAATLVVGVSG